MDSLQSDFDELKQDIADVNSGASSSRDGQKYLGHNYIGWYAAGRRGPPSR